MTTGFLLTLVASLLLIATTGGAAETQAGAPAQSVNARLTDESANVLKMRRDAARRVYEARIAKFKSGRVPANVVLQSNLRLLHSSLAIASPDAAVEYDCRARDIEAIAQKNLEAGAGTRQDVEQSKSVRLDVIIKDSLVCPDSSNN